jgi:hypothetical protein
MLSRLNTHGRGMACSTVRALTFHAYQEQLANAGFVDIAVTSIHEFGEQPADSAT